ncbi:MAG: hypothetical protein AB7N99_05120 [Simkaniaceae bacterium]
MSNYLILDATNLFTRLSENTSFYSEKGKEYFFWGVENGSHFLSQSIDKIIQSLSKTWRDQKPELQKKIFTIWSYVKNTPTQQDDPLNMLIRKVIFASLISLPTALLFKDYVDRSNDTSLPSSFSLVGCFTHIFKCYLYVYVMDSVISYIAKQLDSIEKQENIE